MCLEAHDTKSIDSKFRSAHQNTWCDPVHGSQPETHWERTFFVPLIECVIVERIILSLRLCLRFYVLNSLSHFLPHFCGTFELAHDTFQPIKCMSTISSNRQIVVTLFIMRVTCFPAITFCVCVNHRLINSILLYSRSRDEWHDVLSRGLAVIIIKELTYSLWL